ncbi:Dihydrolipoyllysine-residue succinyltransferase component of 2-oxoglutarate dehydrogenase complex [Caldibacillus thermoamylovorans]|uniref:Dihydrolipoyllysine-residue succinyltransferase component of 2-oxoglutarate dehydrogenase complex n=1 Tax=Caldibacillus thermoamylovorans TaxID=35841 RepID=A0A090J2D0_9BACI|nr:2-oxoglutarate dehydrogenase complex dihydrolipoyllysine-residue succinyltransferase [Caldibacillus thermoamylovorans]CEE02803.1 Dihydrolipoyllysine-residue succinyltransferase component of 2-oxoglutarate dehydrogenase complex [Caldibacillus thermoamylovorans]
MAEVKVPELAESITEGTISNWLKKPGETVSKGEAILELETDKVNVDIISDYDGVLKETLFAEGDTVNVGDTIAIVDEGASAPVEPAQSDAAPSVPEQSPKTAAPQEKTQEPVTVQSTAKSPAASNIIASPAARKLAREKGIDLSQVPTVDPLGRVNKQDVLNAANAPKTAAVAPATTSKPAASVFVPQDDRVEVVKMSRRRQTIAKNLKNVQNTAAILTTFNEVDLSAVMELRKKRKDEFLKQHDVKLGFMSFFTKAVVAALKQIPYLNAEIHDNEFILKKYYNIGIAVSTDSGLVVPVVRDADRKNFAEIEKEIADLAIKARESKLALADMQDGTFTITNGGTFGSLLSTPILNAPQVGILGMHSIKYRPVAVDNNTRIEIRPMMYIALSYDHRIVDGKEAVTFLVKVKEMLEDPEKLLLES